MILDSELRVEFPIPGIVKLLTIVSDNDERNPKSTNNELPGEVTDVLLGDFCQRLSLHLLGEVVDGHY